MLKFDLKGSRGITIVALIVTIVVLLILASISVAVLNSKNGTIKIAIDSQIETELSQLQQRLNNYKTKYEADRIERGD